MILRSKDRDGNRLVIGSRVRVVLRGSPRAHVERFMDDIAGGVILDRRVDGTAYWNVKDLVRVK